MPDRPDTSPRHQREDELDQRVAALWRVESPRVVARLMRLVGDLDTAHFLRAAAITQNSVERKTCSAALPSAQPCTRRLTRSPWLAR